MKKPVSIFLAGIILPAAIVSAQLAEAEQALRAGVPEVAAHKLRESLRTNLTPEERAEVQLKLAEVELLANRAEAALDILHLLPASTRATFCRARALGSLGRWTEALPLFREVSLAGTPELSSAARLCEAEALNALGRVQEAIAAGEAIPHPDASARLRLAAICFDAGKFKRGGELLASVQPVTASEKKWKQYLQARALAAQDQPAPALFDFEQLLKDPRGLTPGMFLGATLGMAECHVALHGLEAAETVLERFIANHPSHPLLGIAFERLDENYERQEDSSASELQKWAQSPPASRTAYATFYLARSYLREKKRDKGVRVLQSFLRSYPDHSLAAQASMILGEQLAEDKKFGPAIEALENAMRRAPTPDFLARAEIAAGQIYFDQREFVLAASAFRNAAGRTPEHGSLAMFNAALAWLHQGNHQKFSAAYTELSAREPESEWRRTLLLEEGFLQARTGDAGGAASLQRFVDHFPADRRVPEARVAMAELAFVQGDRSAAAEYLRAANETASNSAASERGDYLAVFLADAPEQRDERRVIALGEAFLRAHPGSSLLPEVQMKLGQVHFRREDFANAQTYFELLVRTYPESPLVETALFLAGRAAMRSMAAGGADRALDLLEQVTRLDGPLKLHARAEQALLQSRLGRENEAIILYENILSANPEPELRSAALCGKADNLHALAGDDDKALDAAIAAFEKLAASPGVTPLWRNQALYKKAKCLERRKDNAGALATHYDVLDAQAQTGSEPEYFWFYKAGFDAARLLEADQKWPSAIRVYEKLAAAAGPRAEEAKARASQLRLEHFVWDE